MKKNVVHRTFFATKLDWFHTRKLKYELTKQHSFNFQCFRMTIQTKGQFVIIHCDNFHYSLLQAIEQINYKQIMLFFYDKLFKKALI